MPLGYNIFGGQIQNFAQRIIVGERRFVFGDLSELAIEPLNDIGCIYDFPDLRRVCIKGG